MYPAVVQTRAPALINFSSSMGGSLRKGGRGHGGDCNGSESYDGTDSAGRHPSNGLFTSTHAMLDHLEPPLTSPGTMGITPVPASTPISDIPCPSSNGIMSQAQPHRYHNQKQGTSMYTRSNGNGVSDATAIINDGIISVFAGYGEEVPSYTPEKHSAAESTKSGAIGAGSAVASSAVSRGMFLPTVGVDMVGNRPAACSRATSELLPVSTIEYNNWRPVGPGIGSDTGEFYRNGPLSSTAAKRQQTWGDEPQSLRSSLLGSSPIRPQYGVETSQSQDGTSIAKRSRGMSAADRLSTAFGTEGRASLLYSLNAPLASTSTPTYYPLPANVSSGGEYRRGDGSKGMSSLNSAPELTQPGVDMFSLSQRALLDATTEPDFAGNGLGYGSSDFSSGAPGQPNLFAPCLNGNSHSYSTDGERVLTPDEKLELSRIRNREHSRKSRHRKKVMVESMKKQVEELGAYRMLVEQAHDLISAHTTDDQALFLYASKAFQRLLGINPKVLLGAKFVDIVHQDDVVRVSEALRSALLYNEVTQVRYRLRHLSKGEQLAETSFRMVTTRLFAVTRIHDPTTTDQGARR